MDERTALSMLSAAVPEAGDDAAVVDGLVLTTDMLHDGTDFPARTTRYTAGWRAVGASLSDVAAMGAEAVAAVAAYGTPTFDSAELTAFVEGASDVCERVDGTYVGGDLDEHGEFTVATTALGRTDDPVRRTGARPGDRLCVTGHLGRTAAGLAAFDRGDAERGNELFQFTPRVAAGLALNGAATAAMDSSDGLARSLHQLAAASDCGFAIDGDAVPVHPAVEEYAPGLAERDEMARHVGEDFELVATVPPGALGRVRDASPTPIVDVGEVVADGVTIDGDPLPDRGFQHGVDE
jgi:thiamine-monophosphate kinase